VSKLYVIPTPIGNLDDITLRAIRYLKEVSLVLAEDTRTSKRLFSHFDIQTPITSFHMYNEHRVLNKFINIIKSGQKIALISDAGTPGISDPGFLLVRECIDKEIDVECLPGPTAFVPALINSGIPSEKFIFEGFLPLKKGRKSRLEFLSNEKRTIIFYESPHRLVKTLSQICQNFGESRKLSISREISKIYEENIRGTAKELLTYYENKKPKGEIVIIVEGKR
tara:strand:- start:347 stop:1018 length:672 start_codon:yes stop_codon:yes gene_type:complete